MQLSHRHAPLLALATLAALGLAAERPAQAQATKDTANGDYYQFVSAPSVAWTTANTDADGMTYTDGAGNVLQGHLAAITSADENTFVTNLLLGTNNAWLGGYRISQANDNSDFAWVTGEAFTYSNWQPGEPNNANGGEPYVEIYSGSTWNDTQAGGLLSGYVVEYNTPVAPEPSSVAAFAFTGLGAAALMLRARKRSPHCGA